MYIIKKTSDKIVSIKDKAWENANVAEVNVRNWEGYAKAPKTEAKLLYSDFGIHVQLMTDENPLRATVREQNGPVCKDSCMEFFVRPNENDPRYVNIEINPFGTMYLGLRTSRHDCVHPEYDKDYFEIQSYVDNEKWMLQFVIPFEIIKEIFGGHTKTMYGNLYKCGDETESPHYATYYPITSENPDYHRPECFGEFVLE